MLWYNSLISRPLTIKDNLFYIPAYWLMIVASRIESIPVYTHTCTLALYFPPSNTQLDHTLIVLL